MGFFDHEIRTLDGDADALAAVRGHVVLAVNVASRCGYTPQYAGLQALYEECREAGLTIVGFPCNQFGAQEPGSADEIRQFCSTRYNVSFPITEKIDVNGAERHAIYAWLTDPANGHPGDIEWNFEKFLIDRDGRLVGRYPSGTAPEDAGLRTDIAEALSGE